MNLAIGLVVIVGVLAIAWATIKGFPEIAKAIGGKVSIWDVGLVVFAALTLIGVFMKYAKDLINQSSPIPNRVLGGIDTVIQVFVTQLTQGIK